jgi:hypothetical protein
MQARKMPVKRNNTGKKTMRVLFKNNMLQAKCKKDNCKIFKLIYETLYTPAVEQIATKSFRHIM